MTSKRIEGVSTRLSSFIKCSYILFKKGGKYIIKKLGGHIPNPVNPNKSVGQPKRVIQKFKTPRVDLRICLYLKRGLQCGESTGCQHKSGSTYHQLPGTNVNNLNGSFELHNPSQTKRMPIYHISSNQSREFIHILRGKNN